MQSDMLTTEDERGIVAVILGYATGIDMRDWTLFRGCFTDDVRADYGPFGVWTDADAFTASMRDMHADMGHTLHRMSNIVAGATADGARARTYVDAVLTGAGRDGGSIQAVGFYEDELRRGRDGVGQGWRISRRLFTLVRQTALPAG